MHPIRPVSQLAAVLLATAAFGAVAETPLPDPVAPAVIGRPLDQIRPARPVRPKPAAARPDRPSQSVGLKLERAAPAPVLPATIQEPPSGQRAPKQALDDRPDPHARMSEVGQGTHLARKASGTGAYLGSRHQDLVRRYYETHPVAAPAGRWKVGEPLPPGTALGGVPDDLRATLPRVPPGHQYVQLGGEVLLLAVQSRMVVDGVSRGAR